MIGNDIVCISKKPFRNRISRLEKKIFCNAEYQILEDLNSEKRIALIWSIKESAFKCCNRHFLYDFVPNEFCIKNIVIHRVKKNAVRFNKQCLIEGMGFSGYEHFTSSVKTPSGPVIAKSILGPGFVFTIAAANSDDAEAIFWGIKKINEPDYQSQSIQVRESLINRLIKKKRLRAGDGFTFSKLGTTPYLNVHTIKCEILISFSHDDQFVAYAYRCQNN
jgi:phosphopantetheinyl transferase (holo-ACP synthase)